MQINFHYCYFSEYWQRDLFQTLVVSWGSLEGHTAFTKKWLIIYIYIFFKNIYLYIYISRNANAQTHLNHRKISKGYLKNISSVVKVSSYYYKKSFCLIFFIFIHLFFFFNLYLNWFVLVLSQFEFKFFSLTIFSLWFDHGFSWWIFFVFFFSSVYRFFLFGHIFSF